MLPQAIQFLLKKGHSLPFHYLLGVREEMETIQSGHFPENKFWQDKGMKMCHTDAIY